MALCQDSATGFAVLVRLARSSKTQIGPGRIAASLVVLSLMLHAVVIAALCCFADAASEPEDVEFGCKEQFGRVARGAGNYLRVPSRVPSSSNIPDTILLGGMLDLGRGVPSFECCLKREDAFVTGVSSMMAGRASKFTN